MKPQRPMPNQYRWVRGRSTPSLPEENKGLPYHGERGRILGSLQTKMTHSNDSHPQKCGQKFTSKRSYDYEYGSGSDSDSKKAQIVDLVNDSEQASNAFSLASRFPSSGSDRKIARIEPVPRAFPLLRSLDDYPSHYLDRCEARQARYKAIYVNEEQTNRDQPHPLLFDFLYWLLIDYKNPDQFAKKLAITQESFASRLKNEKPTMIVEFVENIAIAIQRIENSKDFPSKWRNVFTAELIENFMTFHVVKLFLADQLSSVTIDLLKACKVFQQNSMFQTFIRVVVHTPETAKDASEAGADLSQMIPFSASIGAWHTLIKRKTRYEEIYVREEQQPTQNDCSNITSYCLLWLLEDFNEPDIFAKKLSITPDALPCRLKIAQLPPPDDFVGNIAIAIWRIENSKNYMTEWHDKLNEQMEPFVSNHIARLLLKNELSSDTIRKLKGCRLIRENRYFRRLIGLPRMFSKKSHCR